MKVPDKHFHPRVFRRRKSKERPCGGQGKESLPGASHTVKRRADQRNVLVQPEKASYLSALTSYFAKFILKKEDFSGWSGIYTMIYDTLYY